jgi:hypothetical protein
MDARDPGPPRRRSPWWQLGQDLDRLSLLVKRAAALGAAIAFVRHLLLRYLIRH